MGVGRKERGGAREEGRMGRMRRGRVGGGGEKKSKGGREGKDVRREGGGVRAEGRAKRNSYGKAKNSAVFHAWHTSDLGTSGGGEVKTSPRVISRGGHVFLVKNI